MLLATGASLLFHSVAPPHRPVLMYFSSQQLGRELPADTSPLVLQHIAYTLYCLYECVCLCVHLHVWERTGTLDIISIYDVIMKLRQFTSKSQAHL